MDLLTVIVALCIPAAVGALMVGVLLGPDASAGEKVFFGCGLGFGVLTYEMFLIGIMGVRFTVLDITAVQAALGAVLVVLVKRFARGRRRPAMERTSRMSGLEIAVVVVLSAWVLLKVGFVFYESINRPIYSWDNWANWSAGAKLFFYDRGLTLDRTAGNYLGELYRPFPGHPLHSTLLEVYSALWLGRFDEIYVKFWTFFYYVSMIGMMYFALRRDAGRFYGVAGAFFLASLPLLTYHAQDAYSDFPLGWYSLAATIALWRYMRGGNRRFLLLSGAFLGIGIFVKNEGLFFPVALGVTLLAYSVFEKKPLITNLAYMAVPALILAAPWLVFKTVNHLGFGHSGEGLKWLGDPNIRGGEASGVHWDIIVPALKQVFFTANFSLLFPFWIVVTVLGLRQVMRSEIKYLDLAALIVIGLFALVYLTLEKMSVLEATGIHRNILTYAPIVFLSAALTLSRVVRRSRG